MTTIRPSIMAYRILPCSSNSVGPGIMPWIMNAPIKIAVAPSPGTPSVSMGIIVAPQAPLLADSEAATPSISPWPKVSG
ncbi:hypothetical protein GOGPGP_GOGPGP_13190, partial [Dysosmobacter welbionis]